MIVLDKHSVEIKHLGGDKLLEAVKKEVGEKFFIVARTQEYVVVGNENKNVSFSRETFKVNGRCEFEKNRDLVRKR